MKTPTYLTTEQAASLAGVDPATIRRWCALGLIRGAQRHGGRAWLIPPGFTPPQRKPGWPAGKKRAKP